MVPKISKGHPLDRSEHFNFRSQVDIWLFFLDTFNYILVLQSHKNIIKMFSKELLEQK